MHSTGGTRVVLGAVFCEMLGAFTVLTKQCDAGNVVLGAVFCEMLGAFTVLTKQCDAGNVYRVELAIARSMSEFTAELTTRRGSLVQKGGS
jgi:hypothetical protein